MNRVRLSKKINVAVGATCTDTGYGIICLSEDGREKFERKEVFAARENHGPENENESEGQRPVSYTHLTLPTN